MHTLRLRHLCLALGLIALGPRLSGQATAVAPVEPSGADAALLQLDRVVAEQPEPGRTPPTREQTRAWWEQRALRVMGQAEEFFIRYPADPRRWRVVVHYLGASIHVIDATRREIHMRRGRELAAAALAAPDIADEQWQQVVEWKFYRLLQDPKRDSMAPLRSLLDGLTLRVPQSARLRGLEGQYIDLLLRVDEAAGEALLAELAQSKNEGVARQAAGMRQLRSLKKTPVELKFTAMDGREIDLAALRGKVVLVDFWATWCGPCIAEMPNVKSVYAKYHDRGFEVIGITLDRAADLEKAKAEIVRLGLPWPQFIDLKNKRNQFADELGIISIPAPLLFDQSGLLVSERARGKQLELEVKRLLKL